MPCPFSLPNLAAQTPSGAALQSPSKSPGMPAAWPSIAPTTEDVVNSLGPADLQAVITLLKSNFVNPDAITDTELSRATVEGLTARLPTRRNAFAREKRTAKPFSQAPL